MNLQPNIVRVLSLSPLIVFVLIALYIGPASVFHNSLRHDFPHGYYASDAFWHQVYADDLKQTGNFRYYAPYYSGGFENVIAINPPLFYQVVVMFSYISGLEVYDAILLMTFLVAILASVSMYVLITRFNGQIALLSLPWMLLIFTGKFKIAFLFGTWIFVAATCFLIAFFWSISRRDVPHWQFFSVVFLTAITLTHTSEAIFAAVFLVVYFGIQWFVKNQFRVTEFTSLLCIGIGTFILSAYYLVIFKFGWGRNMSFQSLSPEEWTGGQVPLITEFGWFLPFIILGFLLMVGMLYKRYSVNLVAPLCMFILGFSNYIGFGHRAFQNRYFWPVYAAVFIAIVLFYILQFLRLKRHISLIAVILLVLFGFIFFTPYPGDGLMDQYHWQAFQWIRNTTKPDDTIYFFYGDSYDQTALLANIQRVPYLVRMQDYSTHVQHQMITSTYDTRVVAEDGAALPYRKSFFDFGYYRDESPNALGGVMHICEFNYWVIDTVSREPVVSQYNAHLRSRLLAHNATEVFANPVVHIIQNNNLNKSCILEGSIGG